VARSGAGRCRGGGRIPLYGEDGHDGGDLLGARVTPDAAQNRLAGLAGLV
jgi:hypothetical protein